MENTYQSGCNCAGGPNRCECQPGYSCCSQKNNEGVFGLCVKNEKGCDTRTGFANVKAVVSPVAEGFRLDAEGFRLGNRVENYSSDDKPDPCSEWKKGFWVLVILSLLLFWMVVCSYMK